MMKCVATFEGIRSVLDISELVVFRHEKFADSIDEPTGGILGEVDGSTSHGLFINLHRKPSNSFVFSLFFNDDHELGEFMERAQGYDDLGGEWRESKNFDDLAKVLLQLINEFGVEIELGSYIFVQDPLLNSVSVSLEDFFKVK